MNLTDEDGLFGFSEELYELDRNTAFYMVERLRKEAAAGGLRTVCLSSLGASKAAKKMRKIQREL